MKVYHDKSNHRYIVLQESELKDKVLGLTTNGMLIVVDKDNKRIDEYACPENIWAMYYSEIEEARRTPDYQLCLYFGKPYIGTDEDLWLHT